MRLRISWLHIQDNLFPDSELPHLAPERDAIHAQLLAGRSHIQPAPIGMNHVAFENLKESGFLAISNRFVESRSFHLRNNTRYAIAVNA